MTNEANPRNGRIKPDRLQKSYENTGTGLSVRWALAFFGGAYLIASLCGHAGLSALAWALIFTIMIEGSSR